MRTGFNHFQGDFAPMGDFPSGLAALPRPGQARETERDQARRRRLGTTA